MTDAHTYKDPPPERTRRGRALAEIGTALVLSVAGVWLYAEFPDLWMRRVGHPANLLILAALGGFGLGLVEWVPSRKAAGAGLMVIAVASGWVFFEVGEITLSMLSMAIGALTGALVWRRAAIAQRGAVYEWKP